MVSWAGRRSVVWGKDDSPAGLRTGHQTTVEGVADIHPVSIGARMGPVAGAMSVATAGSISVVVGTQSNPAVRIQCDAGLEEARAETGVEEAR